MLGKTGIICFKNNESFNNAIVDNVAPQQEVIQNLIDRLSIDSALNATEYITIDEEGINNDMVTDEEIVSLFSSIVMKVIHHVFLLSCLKMP